MQIYKTQYIDRIAEILGRSAYAGLRIVTVIEPDSYPNMVTNLSTPACAAVNQNQRLPRRPALRDGEVRAAWPTCTCTWTSRTRAGWAGTTTAARAVAAFKDLVAGATPAATCSIIRGFATNTANYTPLDEPFFDGTDNNVSTGGTTQFYEWNRIVDELSYIDKLRSELVAAGFPQDLGFIVDTGRNGWGGAEPAAGRGRRRRRHAHRPPRPPRQLVQRAQHRHRRAAAREPGRDARPTSTPTSSSSRRAPPTAPATARATTPNDEGKRFDPMCGSGNVDALQGAPHAGKWFHDQFLMLLRNAYPPLN